MEISLQTIWAHLSINYKTYVTNHTFRNQNISAKTLPRLMFGLGRVHLFRASSFTIHIGYFFLDQSLKENGYGGTTKESIDSLVVPWLYDRPYIPFYYIWTYTGQQNLSVTCYVPISKSSNHLPISSRSYSLTSFVTFSSLLHNNVFPAPKETETSSLDPSIAELRKIIG